MKKPRQLYETLRYWLPCLIQFVGTIVFVIGLSAMIGYILGVEHMYRLSTTPMALNTAIAFMFEGIAFVSIAYLSFDEKLEDKEKD